MFGYLLLSMLLMVSISVGFFLGARLVRLRDEKEEVELDYAILRRKHTLLHAELAVEESFADKTRRDFQDAIMNLTVLANTKNSPVASSGKIFLEHFDFSNYIPEEVT